MSATSPKKLSSAQNPLVKHLVKLRTSSRHRTEYKGALISSRKVIRELLKITIPKRFFFTEGNFLKTGAKEVYEVTDEVMKKMTGLPSPEGLCAEFAFPCEDSLLSVKSLLVLDQVSDPGNVGTLARSALALGWEGMFLLPGCADPFNDKAIRASRGALYKLKHKRGSWQQLHEVQKQNGLFPFIADMEGTPLDLIEKKPAVLLVLGNEASGLSKTAERFGQTVAVPIVHAMESLNVSSAGAILMYALHPRSRGPCCNG